MEVQCTAFYEVPTIEPSGGSGRQCSASAPSTRRRTIEGIEAMHVTRKGQVKRLDGRDSIGQAKFVE